MQLTFWLDPVCPWCWLTSRWINDIADHRNVHVEWRSISLFVKNDLAADPESPFHTVAKHTHGLLRVLEAVKATEGNDPIGGLYTTMGNFIHHQGRRDVDAGTVLETAGLPVTFADAYDDPTWDAAIADSMAAGLALTGADVGTPILGFTNAAGRDVGFFGPVISRRLPLADALDLWDGLIKVGNVDGFWELKRTRTEQPDFTPAT
jgi:hypothetical protein